MLPSELNKNIDRSSPQTASPRTAKETSIGDAVVTIAGHRVTTHSLAVALGVLLTVGGPYIAGLWPETAPAIDAAKEALPTPPAAIVPGCRCPAPNAAEPRCRCPSLPAPSDFEKRIMQAWAHEKDGPELTKSEKLRRLTYLYRRTLFEAENKWADLGELFKSFHDEAAQLGIANELAITRGVMTAEWSSRIPEKAPKPITEPMRARMSGFLREAIAMLERLPP
jgi:hypothetical protein